MSKVFLSLGSNIGNKEQNIVEAIAIIGSEVGVIRKVSEYYYSKAVGFISENDFVNVAVLLITNLEPLKLLYEIERIEKEIGRKQKSINGYTDRIIDIDILLYDSITIDTEKLKIPHPRMLERDFVKIPLSEIAPELHLNI
ncbi:MAG: 2-amino-4-hydroxy-6-hydroxymethyldihydropteridine diphosphokinase [Paludibacter sp.]